MPWCRRLTIELTEERIRIRDEQGAVVVDEPAAVAVEFRASRLHELCIVAVGEPAASLASELVEARRAGMPGVPRLVATERAPWWPLPRPGERPSFEPSAHEGECLSLWPLRDVARDGEALAGLLRFMIGQALSRRVWSLRIDLTGLPSEAAAHDIVLRAAWAATGPGRVTVDGRAPALRGPTRTWGDVPRSEWWRVAELPLKVSVIGLLSLWPSPPALLSVLTRLRPLVPLLLALGLLVALDELRKIRVWGRS